MTVWFAYALITIVGLAGGLAVGSGFVAFITVLDIIPRLAQITKSFRKTVSLEIAVICGVLFATVIDFFDIAFSFYPMGTGLIGLFCGIFVGMLAAALTEVLNVFPILAKRLHLGKYLIWLLLAMVLGKVIGSLFDWIVYQRL
jgi:stage V sporulation protein AB